jgi:hypothetical protein
MSVRCACKKHVRGDTCLECQATYYGLRAENDDGCDACACSTTGTRDRSVQCDAVTGQCQCKEHVTGTHGPVSGQLTLNKINEVPALKIVPWIVDFIDIPIRCMSITNVIFWALSPLKHTGKVLFSDRNKQTAAPYSSPIEGPISLMIRSSFSSTFHTNFSSETL